MRDPMSISTNDIPLADLIMAVAEVVAVGLAIYGITRKPLKTITDAVASIRDPGSSFVLEFPKKMHSSHIYALRGFDLELFGENVAIVSGPGLTKQALAAIIDDKIKIRKSTAVWIRGQAI